MKDKLMTTERKKDSPTSRVRWQANRSPPIGQSQATSGLSMPTCKNIWL